MAGLRPEAGLFGLCALSIVSLVVLVVTGHPIPDVLTTVIIGTLTGGAGIALPARALPPPTPTNPTTPTRTP